MKPAKSRRVELPNNADDRESCDDSCTEEFGDDDDSASLMSTSKDVDDDRDSSIDVTDDENEDVADAEDAYEEESESDEEDDDIPTTVLDSGPKIAKDCGLQFVSKYERAALLIHRASQLERGAQPMIMMPVGLTPHQQALLELENGFLPFSLEREHIHMGTEVVSLKDLEFVEF